MSSLLFLPSVQQTVALPAVRQMRSLATPALPDAPVIPVDDRRRRRAARAASRAVSGRLRRTAERLAPATR